MSSTALLDEVCPSNYFTEIEEHFRQGPRDASVPAFATRLGTKGIDRVFKKWRGRKHKTPINSLSYCAQEVLAAASRMDNTAKTTRVSAPAFSAEELARFFRRNAETIRQRAPPKSPRSTARCWSTSALSSTN